METLTKTFPNGKTINYKMTREKGFFTSHIWIYRDGRPYLHIMPSNNPGFSRCFKYCEGLGYMSAGEIGQDFDNITLQNIYLS